MANFSEIAVTIQQSFMRKKETDNKLAAILKKIENGSADMNDMSEYSPGWATSQGRRSMPHTVTKQAPAPIGVKFKLPLTRP
ncbi:MAG: hypothetical protein IJ806_01215 [Ruminococcus sp.]|nr:hypothetical protein [Ruminococcus sp.]MBR1862691.1 hypothetical protein [Ruminococcus sp.]